MKVRYWARMRRGLGGTNGPWHAISADQPWWNNTAVCGVSTWRRSPYDRSVRDQRPADGLCGKCARLSSCDRTLTGDRP